MKALVLFTALTCLAVAPQCAGQTVWLDDLDLSTMECGWGTPQARKSVEGNPLRIAGQRFDRGVGTHAVSTFLLSLDRKANRFTATVGVDDEADTGRSSVAFFVLGDRKVLWSSGVMKGGHKPARIDLDVRGVKLLGLLVTDAGDGIDYDHADWCDAKLEMASPRAPDELVEKVVSRPTILTPKPPRTPRINGAGVYGVRPGNPFLYTGAATGDRPMWFSADGLPPGLILDSLNGIITGDVRQAGTYRVLLGARNGLGEARRKLVIKVGETICLTPPMGWNSWNCWACAVDEAKVRASADAMVTSGLINHGWSYVNIDDCWMVKPDAKGPEIGGEPRDSVGMINSNGKFPDMKGLADYVHGKGLKLGIYSSPGPLTCAGFTASFQHEQPDAERFAGWGIDYLKYDWCSYDRLARDRSLPELKKPYAVMRSALDNVARDIVFSLCQYGMGNVWEWGAAVGGNCWRTTGDIVDTWPSMAGIGFGQAGHETFASPGHWNDPDMLVVGLVGWGPDLHPTRLAPDEQYTHISLWCLLDAPLLIGCDLSRLDDFTLGLLTNDEVIAINQDPLGRQAGRIFNEGGKQIWAKRMEDSSWAVGLFWTGSVRRMTPESYFNWEPVGAERITLSASSLGISGKFSVRDVWRQTDLGVFEKTFGAEVPYHGVVLLRVREIQ